MEPIKNIVCLFQIIIKIIEWEIGRCDRRKKLKEWEEINQEIENKWESTLHILFSNNNNFFSFLIYLDQEDFIFLHLSIILTLQSENSLRRFSVFSGNTIQIDWGTFWKGMLETFLLLF